MKSTLVLPLHVEVIAKDVESAGGGEHYIVVLSRELPQIVYQKLAASHK